MSTTDDGTQYTLIYWPGIPGRGEFVRLVFETAGVPFEEVNEVPEMLKHLGSTAVTPTPHFAPPILKIVRAASGEPKRKSRKTEEGQAAGEGHSGAETVYLSQSTAIVNYLGAKFGLVGDVEGDDEDERALRRARVNQYVLTAQDLMVEAHDVSIFTLVFSILILALNDSSRTSGSPSDRQLALLRGPER
jgi:glutathione S-transferase